MNVIYRNKDKVSSVKSIQYIRIVLVLVLFCVLCFVHNNSMAKTVKVKYNGVNINYSGRTPAVKLDGKVLKTSGFKNIIINKNIMVPYDIVFKKGLSTGVKKTSTGKLTFTANGKTVKMKVGSKKATVNGTKKTLTQAPIKVKYIKKNKTKILVPIKFLSKALGYTYLNSKQTNEIVLTSPFVLKYNNELHIYKSYMGSVVFNNLPVDMSEMPALNIGSATFVNAENIFANKMGMNYKYDASSGAITISNDFYSAAMKIGSTTLVLTDNTSTEPKISNVTLKYPPVVVTRMDTGYSCLMVPSSAVCKALGLYYSWNKALKTAFVHTNQYFTWKTSKTKYDKGAYSNAVVSADAVYDINNTNIVLTITCAEEIGPNKVMILMDQSGSFINIDIYDSNNLITDKTYTFVSKNLDTLTSSQLGLGSRFVLNVKDEVVYESKTVGKTLVITIKEKWNSDYGLRISKPDTIPFEQIVLDDRYYENKFVISFPGNITQSFIENPISRNSDKIQKVDIAYNKTNDTTEIIVSTKTLQGVKLVNLGNTIGVIVDNPFNVYENIVILDPGHGGRDPGTVNFGTNESDVTLKILYECAKKYFNSPDSPVKAYWTRINDTFITLNDRANYAEKMSADMFVSLHMNSADSSSAKGTEVYYCSTNTFKTVYGISSKTMADKLQKNIVSALKTTDRGVKTANYYVIKYNSVPAVLIELGFLSNSSDHKILTSAEKNEIAAKAIYDTIAGLAPF